MHQPIGELLVAGDFDRDIRRLGSHRGPNALLELAMSQLHKGSARIKPQRRNTASHGFLHN